MKITQITLTPVAVPDVPLLNTKGVQQDVFLRSIIEVHTDDGLTGIGETYGAIRTLNGLRRVANTLPGLDPFHLHDLRQRVESALPDGGGINAPTALADHLVVDVVYSAFEICCLDLQGKALGRPVSDLLGGAVRQRIQFGGYLFYKFAKRPGTAGSDLFGEVMTPDALVAQAQELAQLHGFQSFKLKGGVLNPDQELITMKRLRDAFPEAPLRIDPMGGWSLPTALRFSEAASGLLEYLEDPVRGMDAMAELASRSSIPLATNLIVVEFEHIFAALQKRAVHIILSDHHYWRGATGAMHLGEFCRAGQLGVSMHSNSHLGISLAAMLHVAAATPELTYDADTHYPWTQQDILQGGRFRFEQGSLSVPSGPGLGVEIDQDALARLHKLYLSSTVRDRDDTDEMLKYKSDYVRIVPRW